MLTENAVSPFWGEGAKVCRVPLTPPPRHPSTQSVSLLERELDPWLGKGGRALAAPPL